MKLFYACNYLTLLFCDVTNDDNINSFFNCLIDSLQISCYKIDAGFTNTETNLKQ